MSERAEPLLGVRRSTGPLRMRAGRPRSQADAFRVRQRVRARPAAVLAFAFLPAVAARAERPCPPERGARPQLAASTDDAQRLLDDAAACGDRLVGVAAPEAGERGRDRWALTFARMPEGTSAPRARIVATAPTAESTLERRLSAAGSDGYRLAPGLVARDRRPTWSTLDQRDVIALVLERPAEPFTRWEYLVLERKIVEEASYQNWFPSIGYRRFTKRLREAEAAGFREVLAHPLVLEREIPSHAE